MNDWTFQIGETGAVGIGGNSGYGEYKFMNAYLYVWNPDKWPWHDLPSAINSVNNGEPYDIYWSCGVTKRIRRGDIFFLMRLGVEPKGIIGFGYVLSEPYALSHWDEQKGAAGKTALRTNLCFKALSDRPIMTLEALVDRFPNHKWTPQAGGQSIPDHISEEILSLMRSDRSFDLLPSPEEVKLYIEGIPKTITYRTYSRSAKARQMCLDHHGYDCAVCGFNFLAEYGELGADYIEVHHLKPIADIAEEYEIDPIKDLRPVCSNCHSMLHREHPPISIEELILMMPRK